MKKDEVPHDPALFNGFHEVQYALDEDGKYTIEKSEGWDAKTVANSQYWKMVEEEVGEAVALVESGAKSPIHYYMTVAQMDIGLLASYMGLSRWRVKRHLKPKVFQKLDDKTLAKYAEIFEITVDGIKALPENAAHPDCISRWANLRD